LAISTSDGFCRKTVFLGVSVHLCNGIHEWGRKICIKRFLRHFGRTGSRDRNCRYSDCLLAGRPKGRSSDPGRIENFLFYTSSRPALEPTQWEPAGLFPREYSGRNVKLTTHLQLVLKSRKCEYIALPIRLYGVALNYNYRENLPYLY
jgi:hypothetical protein